MDIDRCLFYLLFLFLIAFILRSVNTMENEELLLEEFMNKKKNLENFELDTNSDISEIEQSEESYSKPVAKVNKKPTIEPFNNHETIEVVSGEENTENTENTENNDLTENLVCIHKENNKRCKIDLSVYTKQDSEYFKRACNARNGKFVEKKTLDDLDDLSYCIDEYGPLVLSSSNSNERFEQDKLLVQSIKDDDKYKFLELLKQHPRKLDEGLLYGYGGNVVLHEAIYFNATNIIHLLLENVCRKSLKKKNKDGNTPLNLAVLKKLDWIVDLLLKVYACYDPKDFNLRHHNPFLSSIWIGSETIFNLFIQKIPIRNLLNNFNRKVKVNYNPLYVAVMTPYKNINIIKTLISLGADFERVDLNNKESNATILSKLKTEPKNPLNLEIETLLIKTFHNFYTQNSTLPHLYSHMLNDPKYKEYAPFNAIDKKTGCSVIDDYNVPKINYNYKYDEDNENDKLYRTIEQTPLKVLPANLEKGFIQQTTTAKPGILPLILG
jgi:hypothetical protein